MFSLMPLLALTIWIPAGTATLSSTTERKRAAPSEMPPMLIRPSAKGAVNVQAAWQIAADRLLVEVRRFEVWELQADNAALLDRAWNTTHPSPCKRMRQRSSLQGITRIAHLTMPDASHPYTISFFNDRLGCLHPSNLMLPPSCHPLLTEKCSKPLYN
eukprot:1146805-Pelagomonas_calceolata.AAC.2